MQNITRRLFLRTTASASAVGATVALPAVVAIPALGMAPIVPAAAENALSPQERIEAAIKELEAALVSFDPSIKKIDHDYRGAEPSRDRQCRFYMTAYNW